MMLEKMYDNVFKAVYGTYLKAKMKVMKFMNEEDGDVLQTIIVIALAVIVAGVILNLLTAKGFTKDSDGSQCGLVSYLFDKIATAISDMFDHNTVEDATY